MSIIGEKQTGIHTDGYGYFDYRHNLNIWKGPLRQIHRNNERETGYKDLQVMNKIPGQYKDKKGI